MPRLNAAQLADRNERIWKLRVQGRTERQIGAEVGLAQPTVHQILARIEAVVMSDMRGMALRLKAVQSGRLEYIFTEALDAWERSKKPAEKEVTSVSRKAGQPGEAAPDLSRVQRTREGQNGDPAYLQVARAVSQDLRDLWGIDAPKRLSVQREPSPVEDLTDPELLDVLEAELVEERRKITDGREGAA